MYDTQREKMQQTIHYLNELNIDMWLIYTSEGSDPCLPLVTGVKTVGPGAFIFTKSGEKIAMTSSIDAQDVVTSGLFDEVLTYQSNLADILAPFVQKASPAKIAINKSKQDHLADGLTAGRYMWLQKTLKDVFSGEYISSEPFLKKLRSIKTATEIEKVKQAIQITHDIFDEVSDVMKPGLTEKEIGQLFVNGLESRGLVNGIDRTLSMPIVMKDNIAHRPPSDNKVEKGDLLIIDFSVDFDGYVSDIARTFYFLRDEETEAPPRVKQTFETIHGAIDLAINKVKPGVKGYEVDEVARNHFKQAGYPEIEHATGHQIGQDVHDGGCLLGPKWDRYGDAPYDTIEKGNIFTIEPTIFLREEGIHFIVEENIEVTDTGANVLTKRQHHLTLIK